MLRRYHRLFRTSQMLRDAGVVTACFLAAYALRFGPPASWPAPLNAAWLALVGESAAVQPPSEKQSALVAVTLAAIWPWSGWSAGLYVSRRSQSLSAELQDIVRAVFVCFVGLVCLAYFLTDARYSRATLLLWAALCVPSLLCVRLLQKKVLARLRARGINLRHVLVVGTGPLAEHVLQVLQQEPGLGLCARGVVRLTADAPTTVAGVAVVGDVAALSATVARLGIDQVLVALPIDAMGALPALMDELSRETVDVRLVPDFHQYVTLCGGVEDFFGMPLVHLQATPMDATARLLKRGSDVILSLLLLLFCAPLLAVVAGLVAARRDGPILYRQERIGLDGLPFTMFKFRTMQSGGKTLQPGWTQRNDPRRTPLGRWLRRLSLDELPQLVNVLRGEMSLVGPRPEQPSYSRMFRERVPRYALRHKIKAGMTGWAQVHGLRGDTSIRKRIELDLYYIENWSLLLDLRILLRTALGGFLSPNA